MFDTLKYIMTCFLVAGGTSIGIIIAIVVLGTVTQWILGCLLDGRYVQQDIIPPMKKDIKQLQLNVVSLNEIRNRRKK